jgi:hypothetical protein
MTTEIDLGGWLPHDQSVLAALLDGIIGQMQSERANTQMTLGKLIAALQEMPPGAEVANLNSAHSYRGYYNDLAFEQDDGTRPAVDLLVECVAAMGEVFNGYKGGDYVMGSLTPVWVARYGCSGEKLMKIRAGGEIETRKDEQ